MAPLAPPPKSAYGEQVNAPPIRPAMTSSNEPALTMSAMLDHLLLAPTISVAPTVSVTPSVSAAVVVVTVMLAVPVHL